MSTNPVDIRMSRYVEKSTGRVVVMMNTANEIEVGGNKFVREDAGKGVTIVKPQPVEVKPDPTKMKL